MLLRLIVKKQYFDLALMWEITGLFFSGQTIIDRPPEVHRKLTSNPTYTTQLHQVQNSHKCVTAVQPYHPHKSSLHFLWGRSNTTPLQPFPHRRLPFGPAVPVYTASLTDMPSPLTAHGSTRRCSNVTPCQRHAHPSPKPSCSLHRQSTGS
jgi:hypothetical protein